jgi:hypothetical protein
MTLEGGIRIWLLISWDHLRIVGNCCICFLSRHLVLLYITLFLEIDCMYPPLDVGPMIHLSRLYTTDLESKVQSLDLGDGLTRFGNILNCVCSLS